MARNTKPLSSQRPLFKLSCVRSSILNNILQALSHPGHMERWRISTNFCKASIKKSCQEDTAAWDQVLDQILFAYRCYPHTSTGEAPYTLLYNRDLPLLVQKLIKCVESYKCANTLGKMIEQSTITLSTAAKMLERMRANQKRHYQHQRATHKFQVVTWFYLRSTMLTRWTLGGNQTTELPD